MNKNYTKINLTKLHRKKEIENIVNYQNNSIFPEEVLNNLLNNYKNLLNNKSQYGLNFDEFSEEYDELKDTNAFWFENYENKKYDVINDKISKKNNLLLVGDNYACMNMMLKTHRNKVNVIYTNPPYNTGSDDFVFVDGWSKSEWASMVEKRMKLCHELLTDDGVIFISMDDNSIEDLKMIMNEKFGRENFISEIVWVRNPGGKSDAKFIAQTSEYILVFAKNKTKLVFEKKAI